MYRYSQAGNTFIIVDNGVPANIPALCADLDGIIVIGVSAIADLSMRIFNSDGSEAGMCGNGICCALLFCYEQGMSGSSATIETKSGVLSLTYDGTSVTTTLPLPSAQRNLSVTLSDGSSFTGTFLNTGVPHYVIAADIDDVDTIGRSIRYHEAFAPEGTNVDFITSLHNTLYIRTYERGVEAETQACGTGSAAAALVSGIDSPVVVKTRSGDTLTIAFKGNRRTPEEITLTGTPRRIG